MAQNKIEKQKAALSAIGICSLVFGFAGLAGGVVMSVFGAINLGKDVKSVGGWLLIIFGIVLAVLAIICLVWGIWSTWVAGSVKATKGSIAEDNLAKKTVNGKVCPKCGCTNSENVTECQVCHTPLE